MAKAPIGSRWRSSYWFVTVVVGLGIATDLLVYSIVIPVLPFQLERLGYTRVSALMGWLLFAYSGGLVISTIPIAVISERYNARKMPLLLGLISLIGSQVMLMEASFYWLMCLARILQGVSSSVVWVVGLALLCDCTPEGVVARQLGIAMSGLSLGLVVGPPVGGALYDRFGFRGPFVFGICMAFVDLVGRLFIIEPHELGKYQLDSDTSPAESDEVNVPSQSHPNGPPETSQPGQIGNSEKDSRGVEQLPSPQGTTNNPATARHTSLLTVLAKLAKSPRAGTSLLIALVYGVLSSSIEPALPLHLQAVWNLNSTRVGQVYLAAVVPTLFSSPLTGHYTDRKGSEWITFLSLACSVPWFMLLVIEQHLALFIAVFVFANFFSSGVIAPLTSELAAVSRGIEAVGYAHVYGAFNLAFGIGSAVGPVIGGQIYAHTGKHGWLAICAVATGLIVSTLPLAVLYTGEVPLWKRITAVFPRHGNSGDGEVA